MKNYMLIEDDWKLSWITSLPPRIISSKEANATRDIRFSRVKSPIYQNCHAIVCVIILITIFLRSVHFSTLFQYLGSGDVSNEWKKQKTSKNKHSETGTKYYLTVRIFAIVVKYHEDNH